MGKRSDYETRPLNKYFTPEKAVHPLLFHLPQGFTFCEPCAGDGRLVIYLEELFNSVCFLATDLEPNEDWVIREDANNLTDEALANCEYIITNPPFTWKTLQPLMEKFISLRPTILLLPADFMHNLRMSPYLEKCVWIRSIGRVKWIEDSKTTGVDNYCWFAFDKNKVADVATQFYGRI